MCFVMFTKFNKLILVVASIMGTSESSKIEFSDKGNGSRVAWPDTRGVLVLNECT